MQIKIKQNKGLVLTTKKLTLLQRLQLSTILHKHGRLGITLLSSVTPRDTGETAESWSYTVVKTSNGYKISWMNASMAGGTPLVILLHYGHGTRGGTFISGNDFINPAMQSVFDSLSKSITKEVANV